MDIEAVGHGFQIDKEIAHQPFNHRAPEPVLIGQHNATMHA
jgi:hypothetical protein